MFEKVLDAQYRRPAGLLGKYIGKRMARDHRAENLWTVSLLRPNPDDCILELGFGSGLAIQELSKVVTRGRITGVDFSRVMVEQASRRNASAIKNGRVDLHYSDAAELPLNDEDFDKAFSIHSIYFWPKPVDVLDEVYRVLRPGGFLVLTILPKERWNLDKLDAPVGTPECTPYSGDELVDLLTLSGFRENRIEADSNLENRSNYSVIGVK